MRKLLFAFLLIISFNVYALDRIALVIGNAKYLVNDLNNPVNDAKDIAASLEELGFEVKLVENADKIKMEKEIEKFGSQLKENTTSLFYYAGHAKQLHTVNYLLPIHSIKAIKKNFTNLSEYEKLERFNDEAISLAPLIKLIEDGNSKQNIIILDACRDNSISGAQEGLSKMSLVSKNTLIAYSTSPGKKASDGGKSRNSPYTAQLLKFIKTPNQLIESMLKDVGSALDTETDGEQLPWVEHNLTSNFCFNDVEGGCAKAKIRFPGIPFLEGLYNISDKVLDNGDHYIGQIKKGMFNGKGVMKFTNGATYQGDFIDDKKEGYGTLTQSNGNSYEGNFLNDKKHGTGTLRFINGATIETEWDMGIRIFSPEYFTGVLDERGQYHGAGVVVASNGEKYQGVWNHGVLEGYVEFTLSNGGLYKGEWKNENPNGKGITLDTDGQIYEGTYINGKFTGHGTQTWFNGDVYVGEFKNYDPHGFGILTFADGGILEGEWKDGGLNGKGHKVMVNGDRYDGDFLEGQFHGYGIKTYANGDIHDGSFIENVANGYGEITYKAGGGYKGEFKYNKPHGIGILYWANGDRYEGGFDKGLENGYGEYLYSDGVTYKGENLNGEMHGNGIYTWANGDQYNGAFENNLMHGNGKMTWKDGSIYDGKFENNMFNGYAYLHNVSTGQTYKGTFKSNEYHGKGTVNWSDGTSYSGDWKYSKMDGIGAIYYPNGIYYKGEFKNHLRHGQGVSTWPDGTRYKVVYENGELVSRVPLENISE